jgi:hypothetical protein
MNESDSLLGRRRVNEFRTASGAWRRRHLTTVLVTLGALLLMAALLSVATNAVDEHVLEVVDDPDRRVSFVQAMRRLDARLDGQVIFQTDVDGDTFAAAAAVWNQCNAAPPAVVVEVAHEADVQVAVPYLHAIYRNFSVPFRIRSGGHSYAGWSTLPDGILLSLSRLQAIDFVPVADAADQRAIVTVGPAVRVGDILNQVLKPYGYGSVLGLCSDVAEGGYTLGGGQGLLTRSYGLGVDQLEAVRIVLADGQVVEASSLSASPDLFWALRGAGQQSFGVVTQLSSAYYPVQDEILFVEGLIPLRLAPAFMHTFGEMVVPTQGGGFFANEIMEAVEDDNLPVSAALWWTGRNLTEGQVFWNHSLHQLLPAPEAASFTFRKQSWYNLSMHRIPQHRGRRVAIYNGFLFPAQNTAENWQFIWNHLWDVCQQSAYGVAAVEYWGGPGSAVGRVSPNATAFYWRGAVYNVRLSLLMPVERGAAEFEAQKALFARQWSFVKPYLTGTYTNYAQANLEDYAQRTYGGNLARLQEIKEKYDPDNVFFHPHSVPLPRKKM